MNLGALLAVACGAVSVREALEGDGVLASAFDSRVRLKAPATVAELLALTSELCRQHEACMLLVVKGCRRSGQLFGQRCCRRRFIAADDEQEGAET